jgi:hypothetical protein
MGGSGSGSRAANSRSGAGGAGQQAPASGGSPLSQAATPAERLVVAQIRQLRQVDRDPRLARSRAAEINGKIEARVRRLEVEKRTIIHDQNGRVRSLNDAEKARAHRINRSLERANAQLRAVNNAVANIERRERRRQRGQ